MTHWCTRRAVHAPNALAANILLPLLAMDAAWQGGLAAIGAAGGGVSMMHPLPATACYALV